MSACLTLTSVHSPVIQMNSQAWVLQLSISGGLIWFTQYISWTSRWLWSTHFKARCRRPDPHDLLHCRGDKTGNNLSQRVQIEKEQYYWKLCGTAKLKLQYTMNTQQGSSSSSKACIQSLSTALGYTDVKRRGKHSAHIPCQQHVWS